MDAQGRRARWLVMLLAVVATAAALLTTPVTAHAAPPSWLAIAAQQVNGGVRIQGVLYNNQSRPITGKQVFLGVSGHGQAAVVSDRNGRFDVRVRVAATTPSGALTATARFVGDKQYDSTSTSATVMWRGTAPQQPAPGQPSATATTPRPEPAANRVANLTAVASPSSIKPGYLLTITGRLTLDGDPVESGAIEIDMPGQDGLNFAVLTDANGNYTTHAQVPASTAPGALRLHATFRGGGGLKPVRIPITVTVRKPPPTPKPTPTPRPATVSKPPVAANPKPPTTVTPSATTPTPAPQGVVVEAGKFRRLALWALALVVGLGGASSLALLAHSRNPGDDRPTDHLIE